LEEVSVSVEGRADKEVEVEDSSAKGEDFEEKKIVFL
jgi:hypothetical protein